ncbi:MAG: hypothetical protein K6A44_06285 [bacterium]|nr:hypothetical protein [bacterium]
MARIPTVSRNCASEMPLDVMRAISEIQTRRANVTKPQTLLQNGLIKPVMETRAVFPALPYHPNGTTGRKLNIIA